jgi:hypothetical protein
MTPVGHPHALHGASAASPLLRRGPLYLAQRLLAKFSESETLRPERAAKSFVRGVRWVSGRCLLLRPQGLTPGGCYGPSEGRRPLYSLCLVRQQELDDPGGRPPVCQRQLACFSPPGARGPGTTPAQDRHPAGCPGPTHKASPTSKTKPGDGKWRGRITPWTPHVSEGRKAWPAGTGMLTGGWCGLPTLLPSRPSGKVMGFQSPHPEWCNLRRLGYEKG